LGVWRIKIDWLLMYGHWVFIVLEAEGHLGDMVSICRNFRRYGIILKVWRQNMS